MLRYTRAQFLPAKGTLVITVLAGILLVAWLDFGWLLMHTPEPPAPLRMGQLSEKCFPLLVTILLIPLWSDLEGKRAGLVYALPFKRGRLMLVRLIIPLLVYFLLLGYTCMLYWAAGEVTFSQNSLRVVPGDIDASGVPESDACEGPGQPGRALPVFLLAEIWRGACVAAFLLALGTCVAVISGMPPAGSGAALFYWFVEYFTRGRFSGRWCLFTLDAELTRQEYLANRLALLAAALVLGFLAFLWFRDNRRVAR